MSEWFNLLGKTRDNRKLIKEIVDRLSRLENKITGIETGDFKEFLRANNDRILYFGAYATDLQSLSPDDPLLQNYQMPFEPDGEFLTCWLKLLEFTGDQAIDSSGYNLHGTLFGSPIPQNGEVTGLPALYFNGTTDGLRVDDDPNINTTGTTVGFSLSFVINPRTLSPMSGTIPARIANKTDDDVTQRHWGWSVWVESESSDIYFMVRVANVNFTASKTYAFGPMDTFYSVVCTFDTNTNIPRIYVNSILSTEPVTGYAHDLPTYSLGMYLGIFEENNTNGGFNGSIMDFRYWREKILSQTEITNLYTNKYTISNIEFIGRAGVGQFPATDGLGGAPPEPPVIPAVVSFSAWSFSPTSFTVDNAVWYDLFEVTPTWALTTVGQQDPANLWHLVQMTGTGVYARTDDWDANDIESKVLHLNTTTSNLFVKTVSTWTNLSSRLEIVTVAQTNGSPATDHTAIFLPKFIDVDNYYFIKCKTNEISLGRRQAGVSTVLVDNTALLTPIGTKRTLEVTVNGQVITVRADGVEYISYTDATQSAGLAGAASMAVGAFNAEAVFDRVGVKPL